ncbi:type I secretion system permease/ATPase [Agrobacterium cavarae]|uniref:type I secretion system permease/ATPase n=1 Tax=Agrobacterium cavarae TaxID=2528239 RepID=UPI003D05DB1A
MKTLNSRSNTSDYTDPIAEIIKKCRPGVVAVGVASALVNILYLTASFFMLQVYDRVIPGRSIASLVALGVLALMLYAFHAAFEIARNRILVRISGVFDEMMARAIFSTTVRSALKLRSGGDGLQLLRDFDQLRTFLSGSGPTIIFDLPWIPFYVAICFLFHPLIGAMTIVGGIILALLTLVANKSTQKSAQKIHDLSNRRTSDIQAAQRNAEIVTALGMADTLANRWVSQNDAYRAAYRKNSDVANSYATVSKIFRMVLQSAVLAAGAVLVIENQASGGIIIASSILTSRALAPVEQAIANARAYAATLQAWRRMKELLKAFPAAPFPMLLPSPRRSLSVDNLVSGAPGQSQALIAGVDFRLNAGSAVGIVGPSASGKSSLARALTGVWPIYRGNIRLDGAALNQWSDVELGSHIGYLPQDIELFSGTVSENISRFRRDADPSAIIAAATAAGVHDLILKLPRGYETEIGTGGNMLSAGQRQRLGLARALYGDPFLVVLDEPNSNLDADGEAAVTAAILSVRARGGIAIVIAHRPSALAGVDHVMMVKDGQMQLFGRKEDVINSILQKQERPVTLERAPTLKVVDGSEA